MESGETKTLKYDNMIITQINDE